jgi:hypothetical protein
VGPFFTQILRFEVTKDKRNHPGRVRIDAARRRQRGTARRAIPDALAPRLPPTGAEPVLKMDDIAGERDLVVAGWAVA